ncbi:MAG TPA: hypothetical protein EYQ50_18795 [Verrucomicrobiales bacterium]|nr:hypothetical protein [Verrucomicrobiales bacterium]HIL70633.1 hypothetical protein [Verrucomicrobiota bacterium]
MKTSDLCHRVLLKSVLSSGIVSLLTLNALAEPSKNWPQMRGPHGNGLYDAGNPPLKWSEGNNIKWKMKIPGQGHATPIIWEDRIFVLSAVKTGKVSEPVESAPAGVEEPNRSIQGNDRQRSGGQQRGRRSRGGGRGRGGFGFGMSAPKEEHRFITYCLDRESGKILWEKSGEKRIPHQGIHRTNSFSSGSPVTDGERVYSWFGSAGVNCYDFNGNIVWNKPMENVSVIFGEGASPVLHEDKLLIVRDHNGQSVIYALDKKTGKELWKQERNEGSGWATPYIIERNGISEAVVSGAKAVRSYNINTGELLWQFSGLGSNPIPMPVSDENHLFVMSGHRNATGLGIELGGSGDISSSILWKTTRGTPYVPSPLLYDNLLFFCQRNDAILTCLDPISGNPHFSQKRIEGLSGVYASPVGVKNRIYLPSQNGTTVVLEKSTQLKVLALNKLDNPIDASPAIYGDELFLRTHEYLYCIAEK